MRPGQWIPSPPVSLASTADIASGEMTIVGRVMPASNATFLATIGEVQVIYKPVRGERPLWDFPDGTLAQREVAAYAVSESLGWDVVPTTILRDGPHGRNTVRFLEKRGPLKARGLEVLEILHVLGVVHVRDTLTAPDEAEAAIDAHDFCADPAIDFGAAGSMRSWAWSG